MAASFRTILRSSSATGLCFAICGGILLSVVVLQSLALVEGAPTLRFNDPIIGIPIRWILPGTSLPCMIVAVLCLRKQPPIVTLLAVAWIAATFLAYRAGLWACGGGRSVGFALHLLNLSLAEVDALMTCSMASLLPLAALGYWARNAGPVEPETCKLTCPSCGRKIAFDKIDTGRQVGCPNCKEIIKLAPQTGATSNSSFYER